MVTSEVTHASGKPQGKLLGIPYDWRKPTGARVKARLWNCRDPRLFTPKPLGHGHVINGYWLAHPVRYWRRHRRKDVS
jgi:hypothetical protein